MPKTSSIDAAIRRIVADQVSQAMEPYRVIFDRLSAFVGGGPVRRGPGRPRKSGAGRRSARAGAKDTAAAAKAFQVGQTVSYKQGRGTFDAEVLGIDEATGQMTLRRLSDGKEIVRPASKVAASDGAGATAEAPKAPKAKKARKAPKARKAGKRGKARKAKAPKVAFEEGQKVVYKQGRGAFDAKVVSIDHEKGTVMLRREKDGKEITRPAAKVVAAA